METIGYLLQENSTLGHEAKVLSDNGKIARFETVLQDTDLNRNGRFYPKPVLESSINEKRVKELINTRTFFGEASHPFAALDDVRRQSSIDINRVSHLVTSLEMKNNVVYGVVETAATSCGRDMRGLIVENKSQCAFSMRGFVKFKKSSIGGKSALEASNLYMIAYDWVTYPSHQSAYMGKINPVTESEINSLIKEDDNVKMITESMDMEEFFATPLSGDSLLLSNGQNAAVAFLKSDSRRKFGSLMQEMAIYTT